MARYGKKAQSKVKRAMHERKRGTLRSGRSGKKVTSRKQAIAIGLSEARRSGGTNCTTSPSRRIKRCADTRRLARSWNSSCASAGRLPVKRRAIQGPPNSPGGRLMPCRIRRSGTTPDGRASKNGDNTCFTPINKPVFASTRMPRILPQARATMTA